MFYNGYVYGMLLTQMLNRITNLKYSKMENTKNEEQCAIHDVIARLFKEMQEKHKKTEGSILLQYQDNTIYVCEQDYDSLTILDKIEFNEV
jgi:uncharacterized protein YydD (DUF2326 family)